VSEDDGAALHGRRHAQPDRRTEETPNGRYRPIYEELYEAATSPDIPVTFLQRWEGAPYWQWAGVVREAVDAAQSDEPRQRSLRPDAKALLGVNFGYLVVTPLSLGGRVDLRDLRADVRDDIRLLVSEARSDREVPTEISGHAIVDSLSRNWSELRTGRYRLWE
jgi:hypothetical protein